MAGPAALFAPLALTVLCLAAAPGAAASVVTRNGAPWARKGEATLSSAAGEHAQRRNLSSSSSYSPAFACDALVPEVCGYPFPNDFFRDVNGSGLLNLTSATMPLTVDGRGVDPVAGGWDALDGFSPLPALLAYFPALSLDNLPRYWNIQASLDDACPTVLVRRSHGRARAARPAFFRWFFLEEKAAAIASLVCPQRPPPWARVVHAGPALSALPEAGAMAAASSGGGARLFGWTPRPDSLLRILFPIGSGSLPLSFSHASAPSRVSRPLPAVPHAARLPPPCLYSSTRRRASACPTGSSWTTRAMTTIRGSVAHDGRRRLWQGKGLRRMGLQSALYSRPCCPCAQRPHSFPPPTDFHPPLTCPGIQPHPDAVACVAAERQHALHCCLSQPAQREERGR